MTKSHIINIIISFALALIAAGCNNDIFVENSHPSPADIELEGDGGEATVHYLSKGLLWLGFDLLGGNQADYFDRNGNIISSDSPVSDIDRIILEKTGYIIQVDVERDKLVFHCIEFWNSANPHQLIFRLDYGYTSEFVNVLLLPGSGIEITNINYNDYISEINGPENKSVRSATYTNNSEHPARVIVRPFVGEEAKLRLITEDSELRSQTIDMHVPVYSNGDWHIGDKRTLKVGATEYYIPAGIDVEENVKIEVGPGETVEIVCTVYRVIGKLSGDLHFRTPSGRNFMSFFDIIVSEPVSYEVDAIHK